MSPTITLDEESSRAFGATIRELQGISQKKMSELVQQQSRLTVFDMIKSTPPHSDAPITESFSTQKKMGERAIVTDVRRLYEPIDKIEAVSRPEQSLALLMLMTKRKWKEVSESLFQMGITNKRKSIIEKADMQLQRRLKGSRGRLPRSFKDSILVADGSSIKLMIDTLKKRVGWAKSGWWVAGAKLEVKGVPQWAQQGGAPGTVNVHLEGDKPFVEVTNDVKYIDYLNRTGNILNRALANRVRAMEESIKQAERYFAEKFAGIK